MLLPSVFGFTRHERRKLNESDTHRSRSGQQQIGQLALATCVDPRRAWEQCIGRQCPRSSLLGERMGFPVLSVLRQCVPGVRTRSVDCPPGVTCQDSGVRNQASRRTKLRKICTFHCGGWCFWFLWVGVSCQQKVVKEINRVKEAFSSHQRVC